MTAEQLRETTKIIQQEVRARIARQARQRAAQLSAQERDVWLRQSIVRDYQEA